MSQTQFEQLGGLDSLGQTTGELPSGECVAKAWQLAASSAHVTDFLINTLKARLAKFRATGQAAALTTVLEDSDKLTVMQQGYKDGISSLTWRAAATKTDLEKIKPQAINYMDVPAKQGIEELNQALGPDSRISQITMAYYVDDNAQINRGYIVNDEILDDTKAEHKKMLDVIDKMFHSWLVSQHMASDDQGIIYHRDQNGELTKKLDKQEMVSFRKLLEDDTTGFHATIEKIDPNIKLSLIWSPPEGSAPTAEPGQF